MNNLVYSFLLFFVIVLQISCSNLREIESFPENSRYKKAPYRSLESATQQGGLSLKLVPLVDSYTLSKATNYSSIVTALSGSGSALPPLPKVELKFKIENMGTEDVEFYFGGDRDSFDLLVEGPSVLDLIYIGPQTTEIRLGEMVKLSPGEFHEGVVQHFHYGSRHQNRIYWLESGEYQIQASFITRTREDTRLRLVADPILVRVTD